MRRKFHLIPVLVVVLSLALGACSGVVGAAGGNPAQTATPASTPSSTSNMPSADLLPSDQVLGLFQGVMNKIPAGNGYGYVQPEILKYDLSATQVPFVIDVRDPSELESSGYIQGAVNIPLRSLLNNLDKLPSPDKQIFIYSNSGYRSGMALAALILLGYTNVHDLAGGLSAWVNVSKFPIVKGSTPSAPQVLTPSPAISDQGVYNMLSSFFNNMPDDYFQVTPDSVVKQLTGATPPTMIDINTDSDHQQYGMIKDAVQIPFNEFFQDTGKLPAQDTPMVIYAVGGGHSSILVMGLRLMGYTNVFNLKGGIIAWKNANLPVEGGGG